MRKCSVQHCGPFRKMLRYGLIKGFRQITWAHFFKSSWHSAAVHPICRTLYITRNKCEQTPNCRLFMQKKRNGAKSIPFWLPDQDSNPNKMSQSHLCYPYTIRQYQWCEQWDLNPHAISTRPSNVPVCRFQHARMLGHESGCQHHRRPIQYTRCSLVCQVFFRIFLIFYLRFAK